jgi:Super-infection exclusion protein B
MPEGWKDFSWVLDSLKDSKRIQAVVVILSGLVVFGPDAVVRPLRLAPLRDRYGAVGGVVFAASAVLLGLSLVAPWWEEVDRKRKVRERLHQLTPDEQAILVLYIDGKTHTQNFDLRDGRVAALARDGILFKVAADGTLQQWAFNIEPWVRDYLDKNPGIFEELRRFAAGRRKVEPEKGSVPPSSESAK